MIKKLIVFVLCLCFLAGGSLKSYAKESVIGKVEESDSIIRPCMDYIARASCFLYIDTKGKASVSCSVYGYQGITTNISITANLQQYKGGRWVTINTFKDSADSHRLSLYESATISKGYTYRVTAEVKAYSGSRVETRNLASGEMEY